MLNMLSAFPFEAKQTFWGKKEEHNSLEVISCMGKMHSLLSYYFIPNGTVVDDPIFTHGTLTNDLIYRHLFGNLLAGIDNLREWETFADLHFGGCPDPSGIGTDSTPEDCIVSETIALQIYIDAITNYKSKNLKQKGYVAPLFARKQLSIVKLRALVVATALMIGVMLGLHSTMVMTGCMRVFPKGIARGHCRGDSKSC